MKVSIQYVDGSIDYFNGSNAKVIYELFVKARSFGHKWFRADITQPKESFTEDREVWLQMDKIISVVKEG